MRIRPNERERIAEIFREEIEEANRRICDRLSVFDSPPTSNKDDKFEGVRRLYEDLVDKAWTEADEEALAVMSELSESEVKQIIRDGFRRSPVYPVPNFASMIKVLKKGEQEMSYEGMRPLANPDAVSSEERERIANLLHRELTEAAQEIASRLRLDENKAEVVREQLEVVEGQIISRFTPLV